MSAFTRHCSQRLPILKPVLAPKARNAFHITLGEDRQLHNLGRIYAIYTQPSALTLAVTGYP